MRLLFKTPNTETEMSAVVDDVRYQFHISSYANNGPFVHVIIEDCQSGKSYFSDGFLEVNGHLFTTKWSIGMDESNGRLNRGRDLIIDIT